MTLSHDRLCHLLSYDSETGVFRWRVSNSRRRAAGSVAGHVTTDGRVQLRIDKKLYKAHRVAWFYVHGRWPEHLLDHINGNPTDNRLCNLREVNNRQNAMNMRLKPNTKSGLKGAFYVNHLDKWGATIRVDGKPLILGYFKTPEEAHHAYLEAAKKYHGEFACLDLHRIRAPVT